MTNLEIFNKLMDKAKTNGYRGPDYSIEICRILEDTNYYAVIFREDFANAIWGDNISSWNINFTSVPNWQKALQLLIVQEDKWKFIEENAL